MGTTRSTPATRKLEGLLETLRSSIALLLLSSALGSLAISVPSALAADSPTDVVRKLSDAVIATLQEKGLSTDARVTKIQDIIYDYADFDTIARLVLARNWKSLDDAQKRQFVEGFKKYLSATWGKYVESYNQETVQIVGDRNEERGDWTVQTKNLRPHGGADILFDYRLRQRNGEWKVIDLIIERVSLVSNYRSQFQEVMANGGIDQLLKLLREKSGVADPLKS